MSHMKAPIAIPRRSPIKRVYQENEYAQFLQQDVMNSFNEIAGFVMTRHPDHLVFYDLKASELGVPEVQSCIRVDNELHVNLFYKGLPLPLPEWFRRGRDCRLSAASYLRLSANIERQ